MKIFYKMAAVHLFLDIIKLIITSLFLLLPISSKMSKVSSYFILHHHTLMYSCFPINKKKKKEKKNPQSSSNFLCHITYEPMEDYSIFWL